MKGKWIPVILVLGVLILVLIIVAGPILLVLRLTEGGDYRGRPT